MVQGKPIPEVVQWIIIRMGATMSNVDISMYTEVSERKVRDILTYFKKTGGVNVPKRLKPQLHRSLCDYDVQVRRSMLSITIIFH
jgi:hypothetical protein